MLEETLKAIGFSEKEVMVYLTCTRLGLQSAANIARNTNFSRPTVYDILRSLAQKGLVSKQNRAGTTFFSVLSPESLVSFLDRESENFVQEKNRQKKQVLEILPALKSIELESNARPKVKFFEGEKGLRQAYEQTLESEEKLIRAYANVAEMHKGLPNFFPQYYKRRTEASIHIDTIIPDNETGKQRHEKDEEELRESKLIDYEAFGFSPEVNIFDNKVLYASWKEKMAVLIESEEIADFHRKMFDLLWAKL